MDAGAFLPLREDEVTDLNVARRLINYTGLIDEIVDRLKTDGIATIKGLRVGVSYAYAGRYLRLHAKFETWLGVRLYAWRDRGITPIWSVHNTNFRSSGIKGRIRQAEELFGDAYENNGRLFIPIRLTTGADRDRVINDAVRQMGSIANRLQEAFPDG